MKEMLEYLFTRLKDRRAVTHEVAGQHYAVKADGTLGEPVRELAPQFIKPTFQVWTLSGLVELVKAKVDEFPASDVALHVVDHLNVQLVATQADDYGRRHVFAMAQHTEGARFEFNKFMEAEDFLISFRRSFLYNDDAVKVQSLCSRLESGMTVTLADDGVSQQLEIKAGTVSREPVKLPADGIPLIPWRTFRDAAPVSQKFLLRLRGVKDGLPQVALYEIDQMWKLETMQSIAGYLRKECAQMTVVA